MYSVAAVLAVAVMLVLASATPVIGDRLRQALCMVTTLGQGSCESSTTSARDHKPTDPCVVTAQGHTGAVEATVVVTVGASEKILVEHLNNGTFRVTRGTGDKIGFGVGAGANLTATWDGKTFGGAAAADASVAAEFSEGEVYYANTIDGVKNLTRAHTESVAKDAILGGSGLGVFRPLVDKVEKLVGVGNLLPSPDEVYIEGGVSGELKAQATGLMANAQAGLGAKGVLGTRQGADGTSTTYIQASTDANITAGTWAGDEQTNQTIYAKAGLEGRAEGIVEVERDAKGNITSVRYKTTLSGTAEAGQEGGTVSDGPGKKQAYIENVVELPIKSTADQATAQRYLNALGMGPLGGFPGLPKGVENFLPIVNPLDAVSATQAFAKASEDRGFITRQSFDNDKSTSYAVKADWEEVLKVSGGGSVETVDRRSTGAQYWDGDIWATWKGCGEK
jgi:hypothetical protein